ncbi:MAG: Rpn family recombination-promoting nuclease/putative transposase [Spirochaetales bacterium]|nr:Rpn family recombination-promoting nuclease/putative transposase [Spirochaetales bacterium]
MQIPQEKTNRNYKDSVFVDLFAHDINAKENFISLYNALHGTNLDAKTTGVQPVMLEQVLYMKYYNDIAMLIDGKIVILIEHQSTINQNMPFRFLEYIARIYEKITTKDEKFGRKLVKLPVPEFYVFYNGKDDYPTESVMKLSDAFMQLDDELKNQLENANYPLEISVKVININVDKENPILKHCEALKQYSEFIEQVRYNIESAVPEPFTTAIKQAIKKGFLSDYLNRKSTEVQNMLLAEYDYDTDIAVQRKEAFEDGISIGRNEGISIGLSQGVQQAKLETAKNLLSIGLSQDQIASVTGLSIEEIEKL